MANPEVSASTVVAFRSLRKDAFLEYSGDGGFLGMAVQGDLQSTLNKLNGHNQGNAGLTAHVIPGRIENLKCTLDVTVTEGSIEAYRQSVTILTDPDNSGGLIGKLPKDSQENENTPKTKVGLTVDGILQSPNTSIKNYFKSRFGPVIEVQEVITQMYRDTLDIFVRGRPTFSTNGHR